jgi:hypothetical protein
MFTKKTILTLSAGALLAGALPVFADHDYRTRDRGYDPVYADQYPPRVERRIGRERAGVDYQPVYRGRIYLPVRSRSDWDSLQNWLQESPETVRGLGFDRSLAVNGWTRAQYDEWVRYDTWDKAMRADDPFARPLM